MKTSSIIFFLTILAACKNATVERNSVELIERSGQQDSLFRSLSAVATTRLPDSLKGDSLAFLVLPVQISCPSCRNKTIDSIVSHRDNLPANHYIIISAKGGRKTMNSYFRDRNAEIPGLNNRMILDSTNEASRHELFKDNPAIYYAVNSKVYKKILVLPATVKQDLQEFFSGSRDVNKYK